MIIMYVRRGLRTEMNSIAKRFQLHLITNIQPSKRAPKMLKLTHSSQNQHLADFQHLHQNLGKTHISKAAVLLLHAPSLLASTSLITDTCKNMIGVSWVMSIKLQLLIALRALQTLPTQKFHQHRPRAFTVIASSGHTQTTRVTWRTRNLLKQK